MAARGPNRWFFDVWSRFYDIEVVQRATYRPIHDAVVEVLQQRHCQRLLDVGCGTGQLATRVRDELGGVHVTGCDFSPGMLAQANQRSDKVGWVRGNAMSLPFASATFDAVTTTEAFHWFPDQDAALAEFLRVLVPKGRLLLAVACPPLQVISDLTHLGSRLIDEPFYWPTAGEMRQRIEAAGFRIETQRRVFRFPGLLFLPVLNVAVRP